MSRKNRGALSKLALAVALVALGLGYLRDRPVGQDLGGPAGGGLPSAQAAAGEARVRGAFESRSSGFMVGVEGEVERLLSDDREGSRHQRFILRLGGGHTLLVAHNIDLARRVPLAADDRVGVYGQYEWSARGGVLHWTHADPEQRHEGGWIRHGGVVYQ